MFILFWFFDPLEQFEISYLFTRFYTNFFYALLAHSCVIYFIFRNYDIFSSNYFIFLIQNTIAFVKNTLKTNLKLKSYPQFIYIYYLFIFILLSNLSGMVAYSFTITSGLIITFLLSSNFFIGANIIVDKKAILKSVYNVYLIVIIIKKIFSFKSFVYFCKSNQTLAQHCYLKSDVNNIGNSLLFINYKLLDNIPIKLQIKILKIYIYLYISAISKSNPNFKLSKKIVFSIKIIYKKINNQIILNIVRSITKEKLLINKAIKIYKTQVIIYKKLITINFSKLVNSIVKFAEYTFVKNSFIISTNCFYKNITKILSNIEYFFEEISNFNFSFTKSVYKNINIDWISILYYKKIIVLKSKEIYFFYWIERYFLPVNKILKNMLFLKLIYKTKAKNYKAIGHIKLKAIGLKVTFKYYKIFVNNFISYYQFCNNKTQLYKIMFLYTKSFLLTITTSYKNRELALNIFLKSISKLINLKLFNFWNSIIEEKGFFKKQYTKNIIYNCFLLEN